MEGTTLLPFSDIVDSLNIIEADESAAVDINPSSLTEENVHMPPPLVETPDWSILSEVVAYPSSPSPGLEIAPDQLHSSDSSADPGLAEEASPPPSEEPLDEHQNELHFCPYDGVTANISSASELDEMSTVSTTFLGPVEAPEKPSFLPEYSFPIDPKSGTEGILPNGEKFRILIDTGVTRSYVSYTFYLECEYLRTLPKYTPTKPRVYMGNGKWTPAMYIIPMTFNIGNCAFEVYTVVCRITTSEYIWGMKNIVETEGVLCSRTMTYKFLNRSPHLIAKHSFDLPPHAHLHPRQTRFLGWNLMILAGTFLMKKFWIAP